VFNKNGWLPLWHPISCGPDDAQVLFAYDHRSSTFESDEDSDGSDHSEGGSKIDSPRLSLREAGYSIQWRRASVS